MSGAPDDLGADVLSYPEFKARVFSARLPGILGRYDSVEMRTYSIAVLTRPLPALVALRLASRAEAKITDRFDHTLRATIRGIVSAVASEVRDSLSRNRMTAQVERALSALGERAVSRPSAVDLSRPPLYLRTDFWFGVESGGSLAHIGGVLDGLQRILPKPPIAFSSDRIGTMPVGVEDHLVPPPQMGRTLGELRQAAFSLHMVDVVHATMAGRTPGFIYQRYSAFNFSGLVLARDYQVPFVLEYNGSEVWIARNWGTPLTRERLAERIETANLTGADLIVVVSEPLCDELVERGIARERILVNPNGVDANRYTPETDGSAIRARYGLEDRLVVGFIGTMGPWHGAEVLVDAFGVLLEARPDLRDRVRLLLVGDGVMMPTVRERIERRGLGDVVALTGLVPQDQGPAHLAAMDILASPHVPNPDGTPFFGSPTKLFEYMAMGRGIVASDLDQIGEVLEHGVTAWLARPGDPASLADGILALVEDESLRLRLGSAARAEVVARYTWLQHTQRIVDALVARCGGPSPREGCAS